MLTRLFKLATIATMTVSALAPAAADARHWDHGGRWDHRGGPGYWGHRHGHYHGGPHYYGGGPRYYGGYGRGYRCDKGTGGTIIGAIAGGLLGHEVAEGRGGRGDGTTGAIIGAGVGALAGRAIDRNC